MRQNEVWKLPDGVYKIEPGLYLRVRGPSRSFYARLQRDGKRKDYTIGSARDYSLGMAKAEMARLRAKLVEGVDPKPKKQGAGRTFSSYASEAIDAIAEIRKWRGKRVAGNWRSNMRLHAFPAIGEKPIGKVTKDDVLSVLKPLWEKKPQTAARLRGRLENIFERAIFDGEHPGPNPATWKGNMDRYLPPISRVGQVKHHEAPTLEEAGEVVSAWIGSPCLSHRAVAFCILTASRINEATGLCWDELDLDKMVWSCPRRKDGKPYPHRVPLSKEAVAVLNGLPHDRKQVFANVRPGVCLKALKRRIKKPVTLHGCRSTFRDWAAEHGISWVLAEKSLMHSTGNAVERAYQRSDLLEQRRPVMEARANALIQSSGALSPELSQDPCSASFGEKH